MKFITLKKAISTLVMVAFTCGAIFAQGVTTSSMNGKITDPNGEPLIGANIYAVHVPSGTNYGNSTNVDGIYRIPNMKVGGPYKITVSYTGYQDFVKENVYLRLGQAYGFNSTLQETAYEISGVEVVGIRNDIFDGNRTGAETTITEDQINRLPTVSRSLGDFTRLTPQSTASEGNDGFSISFNGMNNRYNAIYIDGAINNDVFGLAGSGTNGGQTGVSPISVDAIEEFQVSLAPFDVRLGGFAGAAVSAITRSGTNNWEGSVYTFFRNQGFAGKTPTDNPDVDRVQLNDFTASTTGFRVGGPLIKNKLFFFVNAEIQRDETPLPFDFADYLGDSDQSTLNSLVTKLNGYGYDPGTYTDNARVLDSDKINFKLDYNLNQNNKLAFRYGYVKADNVEGVQSNARNIRFLNSSETFVSNTHSLSLELNSIIGSTMANNLTLGFTSVNDDRDPTGEPFPYVLIDDGSASITFGSERFSTANLLEQQIFTITDNFEIYKGKHTITIGTHNEFYNMLNLFIPFNYGSYEFDDLQTFLDDGNSGFYIRSYSLVDNLEGDPSAAGVAFNAGQLGFYVQDEIQVSDDFKLTAGVRFDVPFYDDIPVNEEFNSKTIPLLEGAGYDLQGARSGEFIKPQLQFSPRIGFNWDISGDDRTQLRGGLGIFTSRSPLVWVGGSYNNNGVNRGTILRFGDLPFNPDWQSQIPGDIDPSAITPSGDIDLWAEDFKLPQFLKFNLALDQKLPWGLIGNLDFIYNKTLQNVAYQNVNLKPSVENLTGTPDNRPIYDRRDEVDPTYGRILLGYNTTEGYSYNITGQLTKPFDNGFYGMVAYSYGDAYTIFDGTSSQNSSQWRGLHAVNGRNFDQQLRRSDFAAGSRFIAGISYEFFWNAGKNLKTTFSLFHESRQGNPYSFIYNDNGNLNNEDSRERNLVFIPASASDIILVDDGDLSAADQWAALDAFIANDPYLSENRGGYAERNQSRSPWQNVMDLKILQDFTLKAGGKDHTFQVSLDIYNFTNLLNKDWGRRYFVGSFGSFELLNFEGYEDGTNNPTFTFDPGIIDENNEAVRFIDDSGIQSSRWQMQLGLRYFFK